MRLNKKHYHDFMTYCQEWQRELGLIGWKLYFCFKVEKDVYALTNYDCVDKIATITLNAEFDEFGGMKPDLSFLRRLALHEVLHILTGDLVGLAKSRNVSEGEIYEADHRLVRTIEHLLIERI